MIILHIFILLVSSSKRFSILKDVIEKEGGFIHPSLTMQVNQGLESGVYTQNDIEANTIIMQIPFSLCVYSRTMKKYKLDDSRLQKGVSHYLDKDQEMGLAWYVANVLQMKQHRFKSMFQSLGTDFPHAAWLWTDDELKELKGSHGYEAAQFLKSRWPQEWNGMTFEKDLRWAYSVVMARGFALNMQSSGPSRVFVPMLDILNHQPYPSYTTVNVNRQKKMIELKTVVNYPANEQLWIYQGQNTNALLLAKFGFYIPQNPHDMVSVNLELSKTSSDAKLKIHIARDIVGFKQVKFHEDGPDDVTLRALRILYLRKSNFDSYTISRILNGMPADPKSEAKMWKYFRKACEDKMGGFPTTLKADKKLLSRERHWLDVKKSMALEYRIREKEIIKNCIKLSKRKGQSKGMPKRRTEGERKVKKRKKGEKVKKPEVKKITKKWLRKIKKKSVYTKRKKWEFQDPEVKITMQQPNMNTYS